ADVATKELREDPLLLVGRDSEALIAHPDPCLVTDERGAHAHEAALRRVLDRIREEIPDHLGEAVTVAEDDERVVGRIELELVVRALRRVEHDLCCEQIVQIGLLELQLDRPLLDPLDVEQIGRASCRERGYWLSVYVLCD